MAQKQMDVFNDFHRFLLLTGPRKSGKTIAAMHKILRHCFDNNGATDVWLASADWMGRNLFKRIEVAFPVRDPELRRRVVDEGLRLFLTDNRDAWALAADGTWSKVRPRGRAHSRSAQAELLARMRGADETD